MKKITLQKITLLICGIFFSAISFAQAPNWIWAKRMGGVYNDGGNSIAIDASGNVYTTGSFQSTADFDPGPGTYYLNSGGNSDIFISKLDASGNFIWAKQISGGYKSAYSIIIDQAGSGDIFITGSFDGTVDFDPGAGTFNLNTFGNNDVFILKLNSSGNFIWAKQLGGTNDDRGYSLALDGAAGLYTTGWFMGTADFDPGPGTHNLTSASGFDIFISKLDTSGNFIWAKRIGGISDDGGNSIAIDASYSLFLTGSFAQTVDFDPGPGMFNLSGNGCFVSKFDSSGNFIWADAMSGGARGLSISLDTAGTGDVYTTGYYTGTVDFNPGIGTLNLTSAGGYDFFITKLDSSGNFIWAKVFGGTGAYDYGKCIVIDPTGNGNVYTAGHFMGTVDFDPGAGVFNQVASGDLDIFLLKLNSAGNFLWAKRMGGTYGEVGEAITIDATHNVYMTGYFQSSSVSFDATTLTNVGSTDVFVSKLNDCTNLPVASITAGGPTIFCSPGSVTLNANTGSGLTYQWQLNFVNISGATSASYVANTTGNYRCVVTNSCGSAYSNLISVIIFTAPPAAVITASDSTTFCSPGTVTLSTNSATGLTYQWRLNGNNISGATSNIITVSAAGNYDCIVTNACGSTTSNTISVTVNSLPASVVSASGPTAFCPPGSVTLNANTGTGLTYQWRLNSVNISGATSASYTTNAAGNYSCAVSNSCGTVVSNIITVQVLPCVSTNALHFDGVDDIVLVQQSPYPIGYGDITVEVWIKSERPNTMPADELIFSAQDNPNAGVNLYLINGQVGLALYGTPYQFLSPMGPDLRDNQCHHIAVTRSSNMTSLYIDGVFISQENSTASFIDPVMFESIGGLRFGYFDYPFMGLIKEVRFWNSARTQTEIQNYMNVVIDGWNYPELISYWRLNEGSGQAVNGSAQYTVSSAFLGSGSSADINDPTWSTGCPGCTPPTAAITASGSTVFCSPGFVTLNANTGTGLTYQWRLNGNNISGATSVSYQAAATGNYDCIVSNTCGSATSNTISVWAENPASPIVTTSGPTTFCSPGSVTLYADNPLLLNTFQWWLNGSPAPGPFATSSAYVATISGTYYCEILNTCGFQYTNSVTVTVLTIPNATITASGSTTFCSPGSVTLNANTGTGFSYQWRLNSNQIIGATTSSYSATTAGNYSCVAFNTCGSATSNSITVTVNPLPPASITAAGPTTFCFPTSVTLNANTGSGLSYQWRLNGVDIAGEITSSYPASATGNYSCLVTNSCGSTLSNIIAIQVDVLPSAIATASGSTTFCAPGSVTLNVSTCSGCIYQWQLNAVDISGANNSSYSATASGNYNCRVTNTCGPRTSNGIVVSAEVAATASITASGATTFCAPGSVTLNANTGTGLSYQWRLNGGNISGATASSYSANATGNYSCIVTNTCGSVTSNIISVTVNPQPTASITASGPTTFCSPGSVTLNANTGTGLTYQWRLNGGNISGATTSSYVANATGNYDCIVTNTCGSATSNAISVTVNPQPTASITAAGATTFCAPGSVTLNANTGAGLSWQWKLNGVNISGATSSSYVANATGNYTCVVTNSCGSTTSNTISVTVNPLPTATITASGATTFCAPGSVTLNANTGAGLSWQWKLNGVNISGATASSYVANASGSYTCVVTNSCGSVTSNTITVTVNILPATPGAITGQTTGVCNSTKTYSISTVSGATGYTWSVPAGASISSGQGTTSVNILYTSAYGSGNISVVATSSCGNSGASNLTTNGIPAQPGTITGPTSVCHNQNNVIYSIAAVTGAASYTWTVPPGTQIKTGQGTVQIKVRFGNSAGNITVVAVNSCGNSPVQTLAIAMPCREEEEFSENDFSVNVFPNPSSQDFTFEISTSAKNSVSINIFDLTGRAVETHQNISGSSKFKCGANLIDGIYFAEIISGNKKEIRKLIRQR